MENTAQEIKQDDVMIYGEGQEVIELNAKDTPFLFYNIQFVSRAISKDKGRGCLQYIYSIDNKVVATDGFRLHMVQDTDITMPAGYWKVLKATKTILVLQKVNEDMVYPDFNRVVPHNTVKSIDMIIDTDNISFTIFKVLKEVDAPIDINYLKDAFTAGDNLSLHYDDNKSPVKFTTEHRTAVVMPLFDR